MAKVLLKNIKKIYDDVEANKKKKTGLFHKKDKSKEKTNKGVTAVYDFNLEIEDKEFVVLVGPSGCGKSTTLRMIAGLEEITSGELYIDDKLVNDMEPMDRDIAMVFQNYALYPHMTVYENMALPLKMKKMSKPDIDKKVRETAEILDITQYLNRKPKALSGGQRQRVAIGRALVRNPKVFLMDEPLSNLDAKLRNQMRAEIIKLREKIDTTFIYVTHDQVEAMTLGDRIVVMKDGYIQQVGTPQEVFNHPQNQFVAGFIGTPQMNIYEHCALENNDGKYIVEVQGFKVALTDKQNEKLNALGSLPAFINVGVRPNHIHLADSGIEAMVDVSELMGSELHLHTESHGKDVVIVLQTAGLNEDIYKSKGKNIKYAFDPSLMHLFSEETQQNLI